MSDAFISYRRKPSAALANLIQRELRSKHHIDAYLDITRTDSTRVQFLERLMTAIEDAPTFICLLGDSTLGSEWVRKEIWRAYELKKHCVPVFQEAYEPPTESDEAIDYLLNFDGVHILDVKNIYVDQAISDIAVLVVRKSKQRRLPFVMGLVVMLLVIAGVVGVLLLSGDENGGGISEITDTPETEIASIPTETGVSTATTTNEPAPSPTDEPTATDVPPTLTETPTHTATITSNSPEIVIQSPTSALSLTLSATETLVLPETTITTGTVNGIEFVLVPAGDFQGQFIDEFWIARYEVTNAQFADFLNQRISNLSLDGKPLYDQNNSGGRISGSNGTWRIEEGFEDHPITRVTWYGAKDFCESVGARLPTEIEWRKAASWNPADNTVSDYPWGNGEPTLALANFDHLYESKTLAVDSLPDGRSPLGMFHMSGNASEWIADQRGTNRFLVGGGWDSQAQALELTERNTVSDNITTTSSGFRCVR